MATTAQRYHDISVGHRVVGHESKCRHLHGHNYRIHFKCEAASLDSIGRVIDFSVIKEKLCMWVEKYWDHKFLAWEKDSLIKGIFTLLEMDENLNGPDYHVPSEEDAMFQESIVFTPFNPTAENMAEFLVKVVGPGQLEGTGVTLVEVIIEETRKCSCTFTLDK